MEENKFDKNDEKIESAKKAEKSASTTAEKKADKHEADDFCVYLGPSMHGTIVHGTIFSESRRTVLKKLKTVIEKHPPVADLIVSGKSLPQSRIKIQTKGSLLQVNYSRLTMSLNNQGG